MPRRSTCGAGQGLVGIQPNSSLTGGWRCHAADPQQFHQVTGELTQTVPAMVGKSQNWSSPHRPESADRPVETPLVPKNQGEHPSEFRR